MIDQSKWAVAQAHEKEHWVKNHERYTSDDFRMKQRLKAEQNERWISRFIELREDSRIMEIGGAGEPMIDFFSRGRLTSLDPLNDFYSEQFPNLLDPKVRRVSATAEDIPFEYDKKLDVKENANKYLRAISEKIKKLEDKLNSEE